jgi:peroxiredoxin Q/BCP
MLEVGARAPEFALLDHAGERVTLATLLAQGPLVLYFYPGDFTPVCTREACAFRDAQPDLVAGGVQVVGVSPDSPEQHARFRAAFGLPFRLLSDPERSAARAYGAVGLFGFGTSRVTYRIGADGIIQQAVTARLRVAPHLDVARGR